jgi:nucleoside-diphosphate-sugar epimerase
MKNQYGIENSKIFITGGAGFIATRIARELADDNQIVLFDNLHNNAFQHTDLMNHKNVKLVKGDVLDKDGISAAMDSDIEYVIHCAAIAGVDTVISNPVKTLEVNIEGVFNVARACLNLKNLKRFVDFSTSEVFGQHAYNVDEFSISPKVTIGEGRWTYAISKLSGEFITHWYHKQYDLPAVTVRPFNVYGPNQVGVGAIHHFVVHGINGDDIVIHDEGSQIRSWCFVDDFIHGVLLTLVKDVAVGRSYNIGNPRSTITVYQLAKLIQELAGGNSKLVFKKMGYEDVALRIPNITSAREDLGFEPKIDLEEGLQRTIDWYRNKLNA